MGGNLGLASSAENSIGTQRRVHGILSDPAHVEQAFSKVWKKLETTAGSSLVEKSAILSEIIDLIGSEGWSVIEEGGDEQQARTARQLKRAVEILPDPMTRKEALNLFRNILLTVQSSMMIKHGPKSDNPIALADSPSIMQGSRQREVGSNEDRPFIITGPGGADGFPGLEPSPTMKASSEEDLSHLQLLRPLAGRLHPSLAATSQDIFKSHQGPLRTRGDLEAEIRTLRSLAEELNRSNAAEMAVVRELENEARRAAPSERLRAARKDDEVVQAQDKLRGHEEIIDEQRQEIEALQNTRNYEEMESDEKHREAREVAMEIRGWRRSNGSLESEIASEQARSAALRDAFEGRRARYATAEEAARNAEISTMRATRRRIAAEITARREQEAVDEAQQMRLEQSARVAEQCEAISSEIAELRAQALLKGRPQNLDEELKTAEVQLSSEVAEAEDASRELLDLEANISHLEQQTASRESEMYAMQRRRLRQPSLGGSGTPKRQQPRGREEPDPATAADRLTLQATEERVAEGRRREQALRDKLQRVWASQDAPGARREISDGEDLRERSAEVWAQCRALATELGEAEAALARRQAEERFSGKEVVDVLKEKLKAALAQEDKNVEELAQVRSETAKHLAAETELQKTGKVEEGRSWFPSLIPSWFMGSSEGEPGAVVAT